MKLLIVIAAFGVALAGGYLALVDGYPYFHHMFRSHLLAQWMTVMLIFGFGAAVIQIARKI
jgi:hypothetical protein